jgi:hypothetical protein
MMIMMQFHDLEEDVKADCDIYEGVKDCGRKYELERGNHFKVAKFPHSEANLHTEVNETRQGARSYVVMIPIKCDSDIT